MFHLVAMPLPKTLKCSLNLLHPAGQRMSADSIEDHRDILGARAGRDKQHFCPHSTGQNS